MTLCLVMVIMVSAADVRHYTVNDGLATSEVRQLLELPNGQIFANCEGTFCIFNGRRFVSLLCDRSLAQPLSGHNDSYGYVWQGDSLLWLHDFYRTYLFDTRTRMFRKAAGNPKFNIHHSRNITPSFGNDTAQIITKATATLTDRQGGLWIGTRQRGIYYIPPRRQKAWSGQNAAFAMTTDAVRDSKGNLWKCSPGGIDCYHDGKLAGHYDKSNVKGLVHDKAGFVTELSDGRLLLCNLLNVLGYFDPTQRTFTILNQRLPEIERHRHIVGACQLTQRGLVAVYTQNGCFLLDTKACRTSRPKWAKAVERYSDKYNCMLLDRNNRLWVGTQNGLFVCHGDSCRRIAGMTNDCIRSLVEDAQGDVWAATSSAISRVTPTVLNYGVADGIPAVAMGERKACRLDDGRLVFGCDGGVVTFRPEWLAVDKRPLPVVLTAMSVNGQTVESDRWKHLTLQHNENYLRFEFSALNYATPTHTRYRYRLQGFDKRWLYTDDGTGLAQAVYNAVPPGRYVFEAQAAIDDGKWGRPLSMAVVICPPWWLTWWAKATYLLLLCGIVAYALHVFLRRRKAIMERENDDRVNRLFELREKARHQFAVSTRITADTISVNSEEKAFMATMLKAIEEHIDDEDYNVDQLARDVAVSRTNLYKRLQNMLGITPADFIRNVRLKRAARFLADTQLSIADIASRVGFATVRNFSTQFKKLFGVTPSEYRGQRPYGGSGKASS